MPRKKRQQEPKWVASPKRRRKMKALKEQLARESVARKRRTEELARKAKAEQRRLGIEVLTPKQMAARKRKAKKKGRGRGRGAGPPSERTVW